MGLTTILVAVLTFGFLIFIHELGHFLVAKRSGMLVHDFAIGMGPALWKKTWGETTYALRLFPIGGYVNVEGESGDDGEKDHNPRSFPNIALPKRILFVCAGSVMNLLLGFILLGGLTATYDRLPTTVIGGFREEARSNSRLQAGDDILRVGGRRIYIVDDISYEMLTDRDGIIDFTVRRDGKVLDVPAVDFGMQTMEDGTRTINLDFYVDAKDNTLGDGLAYTGSWGLSIMRQVWLSFGKLITGNFKMSEIAGPVGVSSAIGQAAGMGLDKLVHLVAFITINLGVFNLLPVPALDGGRLVFLVIEGILRRPLNPKYENVIHGAGLLLLLGFVLVVSIHDVWMLFQ